MFSCLGSSSGAVFVVTSLLSYPPLARGSKWATRLVTLGTWATVREGVSKRQPLTRVELSQERHPFTPLMAAEKGCFHFNYVFYSRVLHVPPALPKLTAGVSKWVYFRVLDSAPTYKAGNLSGRHPGGLLAMSWRAPAGGTLVGCVYVPGGGGPRWRRGLLWGPRGQCCGLQGPHSSRMVSLVYLSFILFIFLN